MLMMPELPEGLIHALDVSAYGGPIKVAQWAQALLAGFDLAIVQAWGGGPKGLGKNPYCAQQLAGAREAGMMTAIYLVVPSDTTTLTHSLIQAGKDAAGDEYQYVKFYALDIESETLLHPTAPLTRLADAISNIKDKPVVIYSSKYKWEKSTGNTIGAWALPLWDARYDELPEIDKNWVPYGGWTQRAIKQYKQNCIVAGGISADLNVVHMGRLFGETPPPPEEDWKDLYQILLLDHQGIEEELELAKAKHEILEDDYKMLQMVNLNLADNLKLRDAKIVALEAKIAAAKKALG